MEVERFLYSFFDFSPTFFVVLQTFCNFAANLSAGRKQRRTIVVFSKQTIKDDEKIFCFIPYDAAADGSKCFYW
ncbi:MAG: hypothetical protein IKR50_12140 [Prevotella sp.]|nr:hypothetical protein [Prevotella sp.]